MTRITCLRTVAAFALSLSAFMAHAQSTDDSLYRALGSQPGLTRLVDVVVDRAVADARIGHFFKDTKLARLREQLTAQLCNVSGGPCKYEGDEMKPVHEGHKIGPADFNALVEILQQAMDEAGIAFSAQNRLLAKLAPMHRDIIETR